MSVHLQAPTGGGNRGYFDARQEPPDEDSKENL